MNFSFTFYFRKDEVDYIIMKKLLILGCSVYIYVTFFSPAEPKGVRFPTLNRDTVLLVERTYTGTTDERVLAIQECGGGRYTICYYALVEHLEDPEPQIREHSAQALGLLRLPESVEHIARALEIEKDDVVMISLIRSLGLVGSKSAATHVEPYLAHNDTQIRRVAAISLGLIASEDSLDPILRALDTEIELPVQIELVCAGLLIDPANTDLLAELIENLFSTDRMVRYRAARVAYEVRAKEALAPLERAIMFEVDMTVREELVRAYLVTLYN